MRNHIKYIKEVSPHYAKSLAGIEPDAVQSFEDIARLPLTEGNAPAWDPSGFSAAPSEHIAETFAAPASAGRPLFFGLTASDLDRLAFSEALSFYSQGISEKDRVLLLTVTDQFSLAGNGYCRGLGLLHATIGRAGPVSHQLCRQYLESFKPTVLVGSPAFLRKLTFDLEKNGFRCSESGVTTIIATGEGLKNPAMEKTSLRKKLEEAWNAKLFDTHMVPELGSSFCDCAEQSGGHSRPELVYLEIVDDNGTPVPDNTPGELVATPFGVEGMPLLRYRTGDITFKVGGSCGCGRNSARIGPILGRKDEMLSINGRTVYPLVVINALDELDEIADYILTIANDGSAFDRVSIHVAAQPSTVEKIASQVRAAAQVSFPILISNVSTIKAMRGTWRRNARIVDERQAGSRRPVSA